MAVLDTLGWMFIGGAVLCYAKQGTNPEKQPSTTQVSGEDQVDISRWRHNGEQPTFTKEGNQSAIEDDQVTNLLMSF
jgi:hypothetical protein